MWRLADDFLGSSKNKPLLCDSNNLQRATTTAWDIKCTATPLGASIARSTGKHAIAKLAASAAEIQKVRNDPGTAALLLGILFVLVRRRRSPR